MEIRNPGFPISRAQPEYSEVYEVIALGFGGCGMGAGSGLGTGAGPDWAMGSVKAREVQDSACDALKVSCRNRMQPRSQSAKPFRFSRSLAKVSHNNPDDSLFRGTSSLNCTAQYEFGNDGTKSAVSNDHRTSSFSDSSCEPLVSKSRYAHHGLTRAQNRSDFGGLDFFRPSGCRPTRPFQFQHE